MENKTKLIAIKDFQDQGKSTTIWLLVFTLIKHLHAEVIRLYNQNSEREIKELPDTIPSGEDMFDIYAELKWNGHLIIIVSRGDYSDMLIGDVNWALKSHPDYIVCAIQMRPINRDIWNAFNNAYPNTQYQRICLWSENSDETNSILSVKEPIVDAILKYIA